MSTTAIIAILIFLGVSSATDLDCNGLKLSYSGVDFIYPHDVCYSSEIISGGQTIESSTKYYCSGGKPYLASYSNGNCEGSAQPVSVEDTYSAYPGYSLENGCGKQQCEYIIIKTFSSISSCDPDNTDDISSFTGWSSVPYISDYCLQSGTNSYKYVCHEANDTALYELYSGTTDCSGEPLSVIHYDLDVAVTCDQTGGTTAAAASISVECGTAGGSTSGGNSGGNTGGNNNGGNNGGSDTTTTTTTPSISVLTSEGNSMFVIGEMACLILAGNGIYDLF